MHCGPTGEPRLEWCEIAQKQFNRTYLGMKSVTKVGVQGAPAAVPSGMPSVSGGLQGSAISGGSDVSVLSQRVKSLEQGLQGASVGVVQDDPAVVQAAIAGVFGLPASSPAFTGVPPAGFQGAATGSVPAIPAGGINQIQVDCDRAGGCQPTSKEFNLIKFGHGKCQETPKPKIQNRVLTTGTSLLPNLPIASLPSVTPKVTPPTPGGGGMQGASVPGNAAPTIVNQPIFNQSGQSSSADPATGQKPPMKPPGND
jgi:hypothetical protein